MQSPGPLSRRRSPMIAAFLHLGHDPPWQNITNDRRTTIVRHTQVGRYLTRTRLQVLLRMSTSKQMGRRNADVCRTETVQIALIDQCGNLCKTCTCGRRLSWRQMTFASHLLLLCDVCADAVVAECVVALCHGWLFDQLITDWAA